MRFFILYLSLPLYFSQAGWLLWQPVALERFQTALMQEVITPDFQLTCRLDLARLTTEETVGKETGGLNPKRPLTASDRSEEHTSELQSLMRISYAVFCLKKKNTQKSTHNNK